MSPISSFGGIASGIDFGQLVDAIMAERMAPVRRLENRVAGQEARSEAYVTLQSHLNGFRDIAASLSDPSLFEARSVAVDRHGSDTESFTAEVADGAALVRHDIVVHDLATRERLGGGTFTARDEALALPPGAIRVNGVEVQIGDGDTLDDVVERINLANTGEGSGVRASVVSIDADEHRLVLSSEREGADGIDFAGSDAATLEALGLVDGTGQKADVIVAGRDALIEVDGQSITRSSNRIDDVIGGVTLELRAESAAAAELEVTRDASGVEKALGDLVETYNEIADFAEGQRAAEGGARRPLTGDAILRGIRSRLRDVMQTDLGPDAETPVRRFSDLGIEVDRHGRYEIAPATLENALDGNLDAVRDFLGLHAEAAGEGLSVLATSHAADEGEHAVVVTRAAEVADALGAGFAGTYTAGAEGDPLRIRSPSGTLEVSLHDGMSIAQIVDTLNDALEGDRHRTLAAGERLYADPGGSAATMQTLLEDLHDGTGTSLGLAEGQVLRLQGTDRAGEAVEATFTVGDDSTLEDLAASVEAAFGEVELELEGDALVARSTRSGQHELALSILRDDDPGIAPFGPFQVEEEGWTGGSLEASEVGGELRIAQTTHGAAHGFELLDDQGGDVALAQLGLAAGTYEGVDVEGTIGGEPATGEGARLTGATGSAAEGLVVRYTGTDTGEAGSVTIRRGLAAELERSLDPLLETGTGSLESTVERVGEGIRRLEGRIEGMESRLELQRRELERRFAAVESLIGRSQQQSAFLGAQLQQFGGSPIGR